MSSISKNDCCAGRSILALPFAYQGYLVTFKLMTSMAVQEARPLSGNIWLLGRQRVKRRRITSHAQDFEHVTYSLRYVLNVLVAVKRYDSKGPH